MSTLLNGRRHDWVSVKLGLPQLGLRPMTCSSITYPDFARAKEHVFGTGQENVGFTFDSLKPGEGEIVVLASEADEIFAAQGSVLSDVGQPIVIAYADLGLATRVDQMLGCHFTKVLPAIQQGTDPARVTLSFKPDSALINGVPIITPRV